MVRLKKIFAVIVAGVMLAVTLAVGTVIESFEMVVSAQDKSGTCGENLTWTLDGSTLTISGTGDMYDYSLSADSSSAPWYYHRGGISRVVIEDGVTRIGSFAFFNLFMVEGDITIPDSVMSIGEDAFRKCPILTDQDSYPLYVDDWLINGGAYTINSKDIINIKDGTRGIADNAFCQGSEIITVNIPDSVKSIGSYAFSGCCELTSIAIPDGVTYIGDHAFGGCDSLVSITIPDGVTSFGGSGCSSIIANNKIPDSFAFSCCHSLTSITIPDSVTEIGHFAFYNCDSLSDVYYTGTQSQWEAITIGYYNKWLLNATIHYNATPAATTTNNSTTLPTGDLNGDGSITIQDACNALMAYSKTSAGLSTGLTSAQRKAADVDGDGKITINDAYKILQYYANTAAGNNVTWSKILG